MVTPDVAALYIDPRELSAEGRRRTPPPFTEFLIALARRSRRAVAA